MENQRKTRCPEVALCALLFLAGCTSAPTAPATSRERDREVAKLSIAQVGFGQNARYVYCEESACPRPTTKTAPDSEDVATDATHGASGMASYQSADVVRPGMAQGMEATGRTAGRRHAMNTKPRNAAARATKQQPRLPDTTSDFNLPIAVYIRGIPK